MKGGLHWKLQLPAHMGMALLGAVHTTPHWPQFDESLAVFTHEPLQLVSVPQLLVQLPDLQTVALPQLVAQSPQCCELDCMSTHEPLQSV